MVSTTGCLFVINHEETASCEISHSVHMYTHLLLYNLGHNNELAAKETELLSYSQ